jgi:hypothetical protein
MYQAEIEHFDDARGGSDHVLWLEIPVHDALCVSGGKRTRQLRRDIDDLGHRNRPRFDQRPERRTGNVLTSQVQLVTDLLECVDRGDAWMRQRGAGSRFLPQPLAAAPVAAELGRKGLERHTAGQTSVVGKIDDSHAAAADLVPDDVRADEAAIEGLAAIERLAVTSHEKIGGRLEHRSFDEVAGTVVSGEQRRHLRAQREVAAAGLVEKRAALATLPRESGIEHLARARPLARVHGDSRCRARAPATLSRGPIGA